MRKRTHVLLRRIFIRLGVSLCIMGALFVYFRTGFFTIHTYKIEGVPEDYQQTVEARLNAYEAQKLYKVFPGNRVLSYHGSAIEAAIHEILPNTSSVSITTMSLHTLKISVTSYVPLFKVGERQAITKDATLYTEIHDMSGFPLLSFSTSSIITPDLLSKVSDIIPKISATLFPVQSIYIDEYSDVRISGENSSSSVVLSASSDVDKVWSNLLSAIDTEPLKSKLGANKNQMEYLDTRFGNKVFYKFTNEAKPVIIQSHETTLASSTLLSN